ncbi:hypothetical protein [Qipengyuania sp. MTN3-11]|uniref:nSTAND3 domain-containing NTPase n=1 Tax=Qipengyuania sp. MTN3-11 TaxID=3056557 RepID=UPI0036F1978B
MKQSGGNQRGTATTTPAKPDLTGAAAALAGYDYQVDVSILAAIRLMLVSKSANRITLEPANQDDLEADLAPDCPGRVEPRTTLTNGHRLIIQVKRRSGEPWSIADFDALLNHGKKRRPARTHLADPKVRYLLVTSAAAKGVAMDLEVDGFEEPADKDKFPASLIGTLSADAAGRVAIWAGLSEDLLALRLREVMTDLLHVPAMRQPDLLAALRAQAEARMRLGTPGTWTREDLLATVRQHGGHLASSASLEAFVPPSNFEQMEELLAARNAIIIKGPSGTGKTEAARKLCENARKRNGALELVVIKPTDAPASTRRLVDTGPTLFYIEDPWGQYSLLGGSEAWTEQLPRLLLDYARPDHQYVITTRTDMLTAAQAGDDLKHWWIELDSDRYKEGQLARIYDQRLKLLQVDMQDKALTFRGNALNTLTTPLQVSLYFGQLAKGPEPGESDADFLHRLLRLSDREAVAGEVNRYLKELDGEGLASVIWALIVARGQFDREQLVAVRRLLRRAQPALGDGLEGVVDRLVAANHLRQPDQTVAFAHPSVRQGFEAFIKRNWFRSEDAIRTLIKALTQLTGSFRDWGLETAALVVQAARTLSRQVGGLDQAFEIDESEQDAIDAWLDSGLLEPGAVFPSLLQLASDIGSAKSVPSEVARWLLTGVRRGGEMFLTTWKPPVFEDDWYVRIAADPRTKDIAARFVREGLPFERSTYGPQFAFALDRLATDLTPAFVDAANIMMGGGFDSNVQAVANGAARDLQAYEAVLSAALDDLAAVSLDHATRGASQWRAIEDGELDAGAEEYYRDAHEDDGYASGVFVDAYIEAKRTVRDWRDIRDHRRNTKLVWNWSRSIACSRKEAAEDEVRALLALARDTNDEHQAWWAAREQWRPGFADLLEERLLAHPRDTQLRSELAYTALLKSKSTLVAALSTLNDPVDRVSLVVDTLRAIDRTDSKGRALRRRALASKLDATLAELIEALPRKRTSARGVGPTTLALLETAASSAPPDILATIVPVMLASGSKPSGVITRWLDETQDKDFAVSAVEAALAIKDDTVLERALRHPRADARRAALQALAPRLPEDLPDGVLALARDPGSKVRRAMVQVLASRVHPEHLKLLLDLTNDRWSDADQRYDEPESLPIAREAVEALDAYSALSDADCDRLLALAEETRDRLLSAFALIIAAAKGSASTREKIWAIASRPAAKWVRLDALDALADSPLVEASIVAQVTPELVMALPHIVAIPAVTLVASHAPVGTAVSMLERIASANRHRALLLIGALGLQSRDLQAAAHVLELLGPNHPAATLLSSAAPLPPNALDDLGPAMLRKHVRAKLGIRIAQPTPVGD